MKRPCNNCPFVRSSSFAISGLRRAPELRDQFREGAHFTCHKTTKETGDGSMQLCFGQMKVLLKEGEIPNQTMRIAGRLGLIPSCDEIEAEPTDVYDNFDEWVEVMTR